MITVLTGDSSFEIDRALRGLREQFNGVVEVIDGDELELRQLPDLLMGGTLFANERLVIIKQLADNKVIWPVLGDWLGRVSDDVLLVLVEPKLDKRTAAYKALQKQAEVREYKAWAERDTAKAEQWVMAEMKLLGGTLDKKCAQLLVARVGVDQWALYQALQKLVVLGEVTPAVITEVIEANPAANVFELFEAALRGNSAKIAQLITDLQLTEDPYRLFGLLSGQAFQLAALSAAPHDANVAKDVGAHPFALSKLSPYAKQNGPTGAKKVIAAFAEADVAMKTSVAEPWLALERALQKIATH